MTAYKSSHFSLPPLLLVLSGIFLLNCSGDVEDVKDTSQTKTKEAIPSILDEIDPIRSENSVKVDKPKSFADAYSAAHKANDNKDYDKAIQYATYAIEFEPQNGKGYYERGYARYEFGMYSSKEAVRDLEKAKELKFVDASLYKTLANLYVTIGDKEKALLNLNEAVKLDPGKKYLYQMRASILSERGKREEALKDLGMFIKLSPESLRGYVVRAKYLQSYGREEEALADFTRGKEVSFKKHDLGSLEVLKLRAELLSKLGRHEEAIGDLTLAVKEAMEDEDAYRMRGNEYLKLKNYKKAIEDYTSAIDLSPSYARASYQARANAYREMGRMDLAAKDQERADKLSEKPAERPVFEMKK